MKSDFAPEKKTLHSSMGTYKGAFLAGGAITSVFTKQPIKDYDLYFKSFDAFKEAVESAFDSGAWCVSLSRRAITFSLGKGEQTHQFMFFRWFKEPEEIFEAFDFTCCMAALDADQDGEFTFHPRFLAETAQRELKFNHKTDFPIASAIRVQKYQEKGYAINSVEWLTVVVAVMFKSVSTWKELENQIGGHYGERVSFKHHENDPFTLDNVIEALREAPSHVQDEDPPANAEDALARISKMLSEAEVHG